jgi:hypothetical protein
LSRFVKLGRNICRTMLFDKFFNHLLPC